MDGTYELKRTSDGQFLFNLKAPNHEVILTSERYQRREGALNGIESVRRHSADEANFRRLDARDGSPYFVLTAANNEVIGKSEQYSSPAARDHGISAVMRHAPGAEVSDTT